MFDAKDARVLAQGIILIAALLAVVVICAAGAGLAWRIFEIIGGF